MAGNHGLRYVYEEDDQVNYPRSVLTEEEKHHMINAEGYRRKDLNKAVNKMREEDIKEEIAERYKRDPTYPATLHGHEPSKGAKIDAEILREEEEQLKKKKEKTDSMPGKKS
ncbi:hypothetical protein F4776DRAFT_288683 [Hypoxylon sp. NC0597]|nr:hypothetical protein F4776DRAFT_288683 [Hypoxylon sp. NC0597]